MKTKDMERQIAEAAEQYTLPEGRDPEANWAKLEAMLEAEKPRKRAAFWYWASAASIALIALVGGYFVLNNPEPSLSEKDSTLAQTPHNYRIPDPNSLPNPVEIVPRLDSIREETEYLTLSGGSGAVYNWSSVEMSGSYAYAPSIQNAYPSPYQTYSITYAWNGNSTLLLNERNNLPMMAKTDGLDGIFKKKQKEIEETERGESKDGPLVFRPQVEPQRTEGYGKIVENLFLSPKDHPLSTFSIDVDAASYSNMRRFIEDNQLPPRDAIRTEEFINYFDYDYPQPTGAVPFKVISEISDCPWNPKHQLLHLGLQGKTIQKEDLPPSNLVFLIDVSGSMQEENKLPLLVTSFKKLVEQMRKQDFVSIVVYAGAAGTVLEPTPGNQKQTILESLDQLQAGGSTAGAEGIEQAYALAKQHFMPKGNNRVILATDGDFNVGPSSNTELVNLIEEKRKEGIFLSVLGFGMGNYQDDMMQQLADNGNGNHSYIDSEQEAEKVFVEEFGGTLYTIAKDVKLQIEFNPKYVAEYRLIGYENRLLRDEDFANDAKDAGDLGSGHTVTAIYEIVPASNWAKRAIPLKYQESNPTAAANSDELATLKLRYKEPDGEKSRLLEEIIPARKVAFGDASENFRWSAAVAEYALLLLESEYAPQASFSQVIELAKSAKGKQETPYPQEFIELVEKAKNIAGGEKVERK